MRVLVVEDDAIVRQAMTRMLTGFGVDAVLDAKAAVAACERVAYDAVVVDACLGLRDDREGFDLVRTLRAKHAHLVLVLFSGMDGDELRRNGALVGADAAIVKGEVDGRGFRALLQSLVQGRSDAPPSDLPGPLTSLVHDVLEMTAEGQSLEAERAYRIALLAQAAYRAGETGSLLEDCAKAVGLSRTALQPYLLVASRWSPAELRSLLSERRNVHGKPISVSHLHLIARLPRSARAEWVEGVLSEGLTVSELQTLLRAAPHESDGGTDGSAGEPRATGDRPSRPDSK